jgi:deoxyadenosine/deoxycytidine kinase
VIGNIATGKSGLVQRLADRLDATPLLEDVSRNPYFDRFYEEPRRWAFHSQVAFAADSLRRHAMVPAEGTVVQDRTVYESVDVFAPLLHEEGHLTATDLRVLSGFRKCAALFPRQPSVLLQLHAPVTTLIERIARRARPAERHLTRDYLVQLESHYDAFAELWTSCPIVKVDTSTSDLRRSAPFEDLVGALSSV